jgi:hypothetical protein
MPYYASVHVVASFVESSSTSVHDSEEPVVLIAPQLSPTVSEILVHVNGVNEDIRVKVALTPVIVMEAFPTTPPIVPVAEFIKPTVVTETSALDSITAEPMADVITLVVVNASTKGAFSLKDCVANG